MLAQLHRPGEAAQTDFTWTTALAITIAGELLVHMLCVFVLPYSNWRWASICLSESIASIRYGVQRALFQLEVAGLRYLRVVPERAKVAGTGSASPTSTRSRKPWP